LQPDLAAASRTGAPAPLADALGVPLRRTALWRRVLAGPGTAVRGARVYPIGGHPPVAARVRRLRALARMQGAPNPDGHG